MMPDPTGEVPSTIPAQLGKYRLVGQLGRGGMADVYLAVASGPAGFNKLHVLKLLRQEAFDNYDAALMFANEARVAALLNHPNVVQTYEVGEDAGNVFMVMEYLDGQSLHSVLKRLQRTDPNRGLPLGIRLRIVLEVLNGLHHAHELRDLAGNRLNLVHRDVTPQNIFITYDGSIKLVDFGVAKTTTTSSSTRVGTIKGKAAYMAPEQVNNPQQVSRRTDIFQIGLVLWEGIIRRRAWENLTDYEVLLKLASNEIPEAEIPSDSDPELVRICTKAISTSADARYATAEEFASDLDAFMVARGIRATAKEVGEYVAQLFADHRAELRSAVQHRLKEMRNDTVRASANANGSLPPMLPSLLGAQNERGPYDTLSSSVRVTSPLDSTRTTQTGIGMLVGRAGSRNPMRWKVAVAITTVAGVAAIAANAARNSIVPATVSATTVHQPLVARQSGLVDFAIAATPAHARIFLDNALLPSNPFHGRVNQDSAVHMVRAEATGYESASLLVHFERDTANVIALTPVRVDTELASNGSPPIRKESKTLVSKVISGGHNKLTGPVGAQKSNPVPATSGPAQTVKLDNSDPWQ